MKKILFTVAVATLCMLCGCTSANKENVTENEKADSVSKELDSTNVSLSPEEWELLGIIY